MLTINSSRDAQEIIARYSREKRIALGLTQEELSARSGVCLGTLRQFEQKGMISLVNFLKVQAIFGTLSKMADAIIDDQTVMAINSEGVKGRVRPTH